MGPASAYLLLLSMPRHNPNFDPELDPSHRGEIFMLIQK